MLGKLIDALPSRRTCYLLAFAICAGLLLFAVYLEQALKLEPCPLCIIQRVFVAALGLVFLVAALHNPGRVGAIGYALSAGVLALVGAATAARHVWIQNLPPDQLPECGPGLDYMLETLPLSETVKMVLHGSGECAENAWLFLGIGIPGWTLIFFLALGLLAVLLAWKDLPMSKVKR
ncbi:MAG: disulfide bond formation protein B [Burkholderiales bacterium]